ncbi:Peptidase family M28-like protein 3 [Elsinoe fawcettii]|nr:Peptidase family M28-like protein 3 [Elsinoe fawcettii]
MKFTQVSAAAALLASTVSAAGPAPYAPVARRQDDGERRRLVDSRRLQADIKERALLRRSEELQRQAYASPERNRVFGSVGHNATTKYLFDTIAELDRYYTVEYQYFVETFSGGSATLSVNNQSQPAALFTYSPNGATVAPLVVVNNLGCNATDYPAEVAGNVALISRGSCEFGLKAALAGSAGAAGAIIYNNINGTLSGTLGAVTRPEGTYPPTAGVSLQVGQNLLTLAQQGALADLNVNAIIENRTTQNVIAQTKGGDQDNVLVIGGHSDSVAAGPGINDDGSGTVGILETAIQLAKYRVNNAVRIIWWSAEEFGLLGSEYYVRNLPQEEREKVRLYLNFDMIASPNYFYGIYDGDGSSFNLSGPAGSAEAEKTFEAYFRSKNIPFQGTEFSGRSDYGPFLDAGIPAGGLFTGAEQIKTAEEAVLYGGEAGVAYDVNYHLVGDTVDNLNLEAFLVNTRAIADAVAKYAVSFDSLPPRGNTTAPVKKRSEAEKKRSGCNHEHAEPVAI